MMLAGIRVRDEDVRELAGLVDEPKATVLRNASERETVILALTIEDRERILRALDDPPEGPRRTLRSAAARARVARARRARLGSTAGRKEANRATRHGDD